MGIAKSENTVSGTHGGGRIRSSLACAAEAIGSAIGGLGDESTISEGMPSWWFPISQGNFAASDGDPDETSRRTLSGLSAEPERLTGDPAYALWFFTTKIGGE